MKRNKISQAVAGALGIVNASDDAPGQKGSKADATKGTAGFNASAYGKQMAEDFLGSLQTATGTWKGSVIWLLEHCNDKARANAMAGAVAVKKACEDVTAAASLGKRISDTRRVFAAADGDYAKTLAHMKGDGTWHKLIGALPTRGKQGQKKKQVALTRKDALKAMPKTLTEGKDKAEVTKLADYVAAQAQRAFTKGKTEGKAAKGGKDAKPLTAPEVIAQVQNMTPGDLLNVANVALFRLSKVGSDLQKAAAEKCIAVLAEIDKAENLTLEREAA